MHFTLKQNTFDSDPVNDNPVPTSNYNLNILIACTMTDQLFFSVYTELRYQVIIKVCEYTSNSYATTEIMRQVNTDLNDIVYFSSALPYSDGCDTRVGSFTYFDMNDDLIAKPDQINEYTTDIHGNQLFYVEINPSGPTTTTFIVKYTDIVYYSQNALVGDIGGNQGLIPPII